MEKSHEKLITEPTLNTDCAKIYSLSNVKCKLLRLSYHDEFVFMPLLHTMDIALQMFFFKN